MESNTQDDPKYLLTLIKTDVGSAAIVDPGIVDQMKGSLPSQSKDMVMETLGISSNTWLKVKRGEPIRRSTAEQLVRRFLTGGISYDQRSRRSA